MCLCQVRVILGFFFRICMGRWIRLLKLIVLNVFSCNWQCLQMLVVFFLWLLCVVVIVCLGDRLVFFVCDIRFFMFLMLLGLVLCIRFLICVVVLLVLKIEKLCFRFMVVCLICRNFRFSVWKVQMVILLVFCLCRCLVMCLCIFLVDLLVKVIVVMWCVGQWLLLIRWVIFFMIICVLLLFVLVSISSGFLMCRMVVVWGGLRLCMGIGLQWGVGGLI